MAPITAPASPRVGERELSRLRWRCRRGLLENDLFVERFFARHGQAITERQAGAMAALMELSDPDLLDLLLGRREPSGELARDDVHEVLRLLRVQSAAHPHFPSVSPEESP